MKMIRILKTKNQRAKNRVNEHGTVMGVLRDFGNKVRPDEMLCQCLDDGCSWVGWFSNDEIDWEPKTETL